MEVISNEELNSIDGGGINVWGALGIGAGIVFIVGIIDGFVRPLKCN